VSYKEEEEENEEGEKNLWANSEIILIFQVDFLIAVFYTSTVENFLLFSHGLPYVMCCRG
jgi:hypothetical protein